MNQTRYPGRTRAGRWWAENQLFFYSAGFAQWLPAGPNYFSGIGAAASARRGPTPPLPYGCRWGRTVKLRATKKPKYKSPLKKLPVVSGTKNFSVRPCELVTCS